MTIGITIPLLGKLKNSAKDLVISALMFEYPLNLACLTNTINSSSDSPVTFQGVRKAANQLVSEGVVVKEGKMFALSKDWILSLREFVEGLQESYFAEKTGIRNIEGIGKDIKVYTFDNLIDMDKFWNHLIGKWFDSIGNKKIEYVQLSGHTWYVLANLEEETSILEKIKKNTIKFYTLANGTTFLDQWCKKYYQDQGFFYTTNQDKKKGSNACYFAVYDDYVIQTTYTKQLTEEIDEFYNKTKNFGSFEVAKLITLLRKKTEIKLTVMKNHVVAEQLRNYILTHFKKKYSSLMGK